jgi:hypothetical protein
MTFVYRIVPFQAGIANLIAILEAFVVTNSSRSDIVVVNNTSIVMSFENCTYIALVL